MVSDCRLPNGEFMGGRTIQDMKNIAFKKACEMYDEHIKTPCCICDELFEGYGNNPAPVMNKGKCCDDCNSNIVIPARIREMMSSKDK